MNTFKTFLIENVNKISATRATKEYPFASELDDQSIKDILLIRKPEDIKYVSLLATWVDDRVECYGIILNDVVMGLWWYGPHIRGYLERFNHKLNAKNKQFLQKKIFEILKTEKQRIYDEGGERIDKIEKEIEMLDNMKPKTKEHFFDIMKEL